MYMYGVAAIKVQLSTIVLADRQEAIQFLRLIKTAVRNKAQFASLRFASGRYPFGENSRRLYLGFRLARRRDGAHGVRWFALSIDLGRVTRYSYMGL